MIAYLAFDSLLKNLQSLESAVIAFSGGVDSTLLVKVSLLAGIRIVAVTADSETMPPQDLKTAQRIASLLSLDHRIIKTLELQDERFVANSQDRCFHCKNGLFKRLRTIADDEGYHYVLDGSNADDAEEVRPGMSARAPFGVKSPLMDAGLRKKDIREFSGRLGLPTRDRPSSPCLSSRIPHGVRITGDGLRMVSASENFLMACGFRIVRVRTFGRTGVIEVGAEEVMRFRSPELREKILAAFREIGYETIHIDNEGYRTGKLNNMRYVEEATRFPRLDEAIG